MVNIPPELEGPVLARAKALKRPVANYLEWLAERDVKGARVEEAQAAYGDDETEAERTRRILATEEAKRLAERESGPKPRRKAGSARGRGRS